MKEGRDNKGRFVKGNPGGPGRPKSPRIDFIESVHAEAAKLKINMRELVGKLGLVLIQQAKAGDVAAARLVIERLCGSILQEHSIEATVQHTKTPEIPDLRDWMDRLRSVASEN